MAAAVPDSKCERCLCVNAAKSCPFCEIWKFRCPGTCFCCENNRKQFPPASATVNGETPYCTYCKCKNDVLSCKDCSKRKILCRGQCLCCQEPGKRKRGKSFDGRFTRRTSDDARPSAESKRRDKRLPIFLTPTKRAPSPKTSQPIKFNATLPSFSESVSKEKVDNGKNCTDCECKGDSIPCKRCRLSEYLCRGTCACCCAGSRKEGSSSSSSSSSTSSSYSRDKRNAYKEMCCPRCLTKVGEGTCEVCLNHSKKITSCVPPDDEVMHYKTVHQPVPISGIGKMIPPLDLQVINSPISPPIKYI